MIVKFHLLSSPIPTKNPHIDYNIDLNEDRFLMRLPPSYTPDRKYGLLVFISPDTDEQQPPRGWNEALDRRNIIFISPLKAGDDVEANRRLGLAIYAAMCTKDRWNIDPKRIYAAGFSGGASIVGQLGFYAPDIFTAGIQICGADFYKPVPQAQGKPLTDDKVPYGLGLADAVPADIDAAKRNFKFTFIVGGKDDQRRGQVLDIVNGGYAKEGFNFTLIDAPTMGHEICPPKRLNQAIDFIENIPPAATTRPTPPTWMAKPFDQWPQLRLTNQLTYSNDSVGYAGSASLFRMPSGVVLAGTARHVLGDTKPQDFSSAIKSWVVFDRDESGDGARMDRLAMDLEAAAKLDILILCPTNQRQRWPMTPLPVRTDPLEIGDAVYLCAIPSDEKSRQTVYRGVIVNVRDDKNLDYNVEGTFKTTGCSGAPVIDEYGQLAAINTGHLLEQTLPGKMQLTCAATSDILSVIKLPPDVKAAPPPAPVARVPATSNTAPAAAVAASPSDQKADAALRAAQLYVDNKMYAMAKTKLQNLIKAYPASEAAKKAKGMLAHLPDDAPNPESQ